MKLKFCHTALLSAVFFTLWLPLNAFAQDEKLGLEAEILIKEQANQDQEILPGGENPETRTNKNSLTPPLSEPAAPRDAELKNARPVIKTAEKTQKEDEKTQKQEDNPLSFNFLYYIIEKFKLSDIVE